MLAAGVQRVWSSQTRNNPRKNDIEESYEPKISAVHGKRIVMEHHGIEGPNGLVPMPHLVCDQGFESKLKIVSADIRFHCDPDRWLVLLSQSDEHELTSSSFCCASCEPVSNEWSN